MIFKCNNFINNLETSFLNWIKNIYQYSNIIIDLSDLNLSQQLLIARLAQQYLTNNQKKKLIIINGPYMQAAALIKKYILKMSIDKI